MTPALPPRADGLPTLSLCLIVRDEEHTLPHLLASIEGAFDEVILVDTGSKDDTIKTFRVWAGHETRRAAGRGEMFSFIIKPFEWCQDFAAARKHADALATGDWISWADADDLIHGATNLRALASNAPPNLAALVAEYDYAQDEHGNCICRLRRERLVRRFRGFWAGRVHEAQQIEGPVAHISRDVVEWRHQKPAEQHGASSGRNLRILRSWLKDEPQNPRVLMYCGTELLARGRDDRAVGYFRRYLKLKTGWDEERAQVHRKLAMALANLDRHDEAVTTALEAVRLLPTWPDSYLTLAEEHYQLREPDKAIHWAQRVLEMGLPDTLLIVNPMDYAVAPHVILAGAHAVLGDLDKAVHHAEQVLHRAPGHPVIAPAYQEWRATRKREQTAGTFIAAADMLIAHDEQLKARAVLDQVPHYAIDHPRVVALRSQLTERIRQLEDEPAGEHQTFLPEDQVDAVCAQLPRARFLADTLRERAGEPTGWTVVRTRLGDFRTRFGDSMVHFLTEPGGYETEIEDLIRARVRKGMTVACVGANIGYFTRLLAQQVGPEGVVHAVEPDPGNADYLRHNVPEAIVHQVAGMAKTGPVVLRQHPQNSGDNRVFAGGGLDQGIHVQGIALEELLPPLDFILVDAQGVDDQVLAGLGRHRPPVAVVEHWPEGIGWRGTTPEKVLAAYARQGYKRRTAVGDTSAGHWNLLLEAA